MASKALLTAVITTDTPEVLVLRLTGEIRLEARDAEMAFNSIAARRNSLVVIDMSGLTFISSLGMGMMVGLKNGIVRQGRSLRLAGIDPAVFDSFKRSRLDEIFQFSPTVEAALGK